jgi:hypothetical protein
MVRIPQVALSKDVMGLACNTQIEYECWIHAVGIGGLGLYGDMPCFSSLYKRMCECGRPSRVASGNKLLAGSGFALMAMKPRKHMERHVDDSCRISFYRAFGICPDVQLEYERFVATLSFSEISADVGIGASFSQSLADHLG